MAQANSQVPGEHNSVTTVAGFDSDEQQDSRTDLSNLNIGRHEHDNDIVDVEEAAPDWGNNVPVSSNSNALGGYSLAGDDIFDSAVAWGGESAPTGLNNSSTFDQSDIEEGWQTGESNHSDQQQQQEQQRQQREQDEDDEHDITNVNNNEGLPAEVKQDVFDSDGSNPGLAPDTVTEHSIEDDRLPTGIAELAIDRQFPMTVPESTSARDLKPLSSDDPWQPYVSPNNHNIFNNQSTRSPLHEEAKFWSGPTVPSIHSISSTPSINTPARTPVELFEDPLSASVDDSFISSRPPNVQNSQHHYDQQQQQQQKVIQKRESSQNKSVVRPILEQVSSSSKKNVSLQSKFKGPSLADSVFKVKAISWTDANDQPRTSAIVLQNENGPCPLLALVNTLILSTPSNKSTQLSRISTSRKDISAEHLLELLADLLLESDGPQNDVAKVLSLLPGLHTGLNINPRFDGTFEESQELALFRVFDVDIVHGWLSDPANRYFHQALEKASSYEGSQAILIESAEISSKLQAGKSLTGDEIETLETGRLVEHFLFETATQLTATGLKFLSELLSPGSFAVLFRNDHFATIYMHPESGQIFMLVTDAGLLDHENVVWETVSDVDGARSEFFNGDFVPSEFESPRNALSKGLTKNDTTGSSGVAETGAAGTNPGASHDSDYLLAVELQMNADRELAEEQQRIHDREVQQIAEREREVQSRRAAATLSGRAPPPRGTAPRRQSGKSTSRFENQHGREVQGSSNRSETTSSSKKKSSNSKDKDKDEKCIVM
ncbi:hypothetical protein V1514DRAFT_309126 [Lipomyces japonicus]|uniref:uncharacterized protein n=1 Tax=Lipomyces japonicus TaxID=56871 RepID=UPI0034CE7FD1